MPQLCGTDESSDDCCDLSSNELIRITQTELKDLVRGLGFPKNSTEIFKSRLKEKHLLTPGKSFSEFSFFLIESIDLSIFLCLTIYIF